MVFEKESKEIQPDVEWNLRVCEGYVSDSKIGGGGDHLEKVETASAHSEQLMAQTTVRELFQSLVKHGRTARLYGRGHHHTRSFLDQFVNQIQGFLAVNELLMVTVEPEQIMFHGHPVLSVDAHGEHLIYGLYAEGARAIGVEQGATLEEITGLADLLSNDWSKRTEFEDDLIAAAWRLEFERIHIDVADRFSDEDEMGDATTREDIMLGRSSGSDKHHLRGDSVMVPEIQGLLAELEAEASEAEVSVKLKQDEAAMFLALQDEIEDSLGEEWAGDVELLQLDPVIRASLEAEVALIESARDIKPDLFSQVLFEVVKEETQKSSVLIFGKNLARHLVLMIANGEVQFAAAVVRRLNCLCNAEMFPDFKFAITLRDQMGMMVLEGNRRRLKESLGRVCRGVRDQAALFSVLSILPRSRIPELLLLGSEATRATIRQVIADVVLLLTEYDEESIMTFLITGDDNEACIPLLALSKMGSKSGVSEYLRLAEHEEKNVRIAALKALRATKKTHVRAVIKSALKDSEHEVRVEALRYLSVYPDRLDLPMIEDQILSQSFGQLEPDEVKAWIMAYGHIGGLEAVSTLRAIVLGNSQLAGNQSWIRENSIRSLAGMGTSEARGALELLGRKHPELKKQIVAFTPKRGRR